jgi:hypothetical protein
MITRKINLYHFLFILFLFTGIDNILAQHNIDIYNKSNRTVAVRINGIFQNSLEPGVNKSYYVNDKSLINFSLSETDKYVVQFIQSAAYQGSNWKFDWTQYQYANLDVTNSSIVSLVPALDSDGNYLGVTVQVEPVYQQQTSYSSYDYDDDDEDLVWYMVIGLVVGVLIALLPM